MNTNLTTDPISYDGWTRQWSTKYNVNYWYNATTDSSVWKDPVWDESIVENRTIWTNIVTKKIEYNNPWLPVPKSPEMPPSPAPAVSEWGAHIYANPPGKLVTPSPYKDELEWGAEELGAEEQVASQQIQQQLQPMLLQINEMYDLTKPDAEEDIAEDFKNTRDPKKQLEYIVSHYLKNKNMKNNIELEGRFGTRGKYTTRIQFNNVITKLLSLGFRKTKEEYRLSANLQYVDNKSGEIRYSSVRPEIKHLNTIQQFCKEDDINSIITKYPRDVTFNKKTPVYINSERLNDAIFSDFNFSVSCKNEFNLSIKKNPVVDQIRQDWSNVKKTFRYMNRIIYEHPDIKGVKFELSIVRSTTTPTYKISDSNIFNSPEKYEIEFEIIDVNITSSNLISLIHKMSTYVLCGLQGTNYPISNNKQNELLQSYMKILYPDKTFTNVYSNNFIGPSPCTLQRGNIKPIGLHENTNEPNIRQNYSVTDKADGERYLMMIDHDGKIYLINQGMNVIFTGALTKYSGII